MDFTLDVYKQLLVKLIDAGYEFQTFEQYINNPHSRVVILRHDVDLLPFNSLRTAQIENELSICGSYYFRIVKESFNSNVIKSIFDLGHEIGYHYETMDTCKGNIDDAYKEFIKNLTIFRNYVPICTICMHGSPLSKYDNRDIWGKYSYKQLGLIGEPYLDLDLKKMLYLTDTGRRWNATKSNIRDKAINSSEETKPLYNFRSTKEIIEVTNLLPDQIMINVHPQRWTNNFPLWAKEFVFQNLKNQIKKIVLVLNSK